MLEIKIPLQEFALKMQGGGLMHEGGIFAGHYSNAATVFLRSDSYSVQLLFECGIYSRKLANINVGWIRNI